MDNIKKEDCDICGENINKSTHKKVKCPFDDKCGESCCTQCFNKVLLANALTPTCMWCNKDLSLEFIDQNTTVKFYEEYMDYRAGIHLDIAKGRLPELQEQADSILRDIRVNKEVVKQITNFFEMSVMFSKSRRNLNSAFENLKITGRSPFIREVKICASYWEHHIRVSRCSLCDDNFFPRTHNKLCISCNFQTCISCTKLCLVIDKNCLVCNKENDELSDEEIARDYTKVFYMKFFKRKKRIQTQPEMIIFSTTTRELIKKKIKLNQELFNMCFNIYKIKYGIDAQLSESKKLITKRELTFIKKCPSTDCRGFLSSAWKCGICNDFFCLDCHARKESRNDEDHVCNDAEKATVALLKSDSKPCPQCGGMIHRYTGCSQVWTPCCKIAFDWNTGKIVSKTERIHSPEYYDYMRRVNNGIIPREVGDNPCGGLISYHDLRRRNFELCIRYSGYHQTMEHVHNVHVLRLPAVVGQFRTDDLGIDYLISKIDERKWKKELKKRIKSDEKLNHIYHILNMFVTVLNDFFQNAIEDNKLDLFKINADNLIQYTNEQLDKINKRYKSYSNTYHIRKH